MQCLKRWKNKHTKPEQSLIRYVDASADHVARVALRELVVTDVAARHVVFLKLREQVGDLLLPVGRGELEGEEDLRAVLVIITVDKLCGCPWMDQAVEHNETSMKDSQY